MRRPELANVGERTGKNVPAPTLLLLLQTTKDPLLLLSCSTRFRKQITQENTLNIKAETSNERQETLRRENIPARSSSDIFRYSFCCGSCASLLQPLRFLVNSTWESAHCRLRTNSPRRPRRFCCTASFPLQVAGKNLKFERDFPPSAKLNRFAPVGGSRDFAYVQQSNVFSLFDSVFS